MNKPEQRCRRWRVPERSALEAVTREQARWFGIHFSSTEQDCLREKATLMVHHEDVQETQEETYVSD